MAQTSFRTIEEIHAAGIAFMRELFGGTDGDESCAVSRRDASAGVRTDELADDTD